MATAKKLKSGSWRCLVYDYTDGNGKRHYASFTARSKKEAELQAAQYSATKNPRKSVVSSITFGEALDSYITERSSVLSPASIRKYRSMQKNRFDRINRIKLRDITCDTVQRIINDAAISLSPKSIRDMHGLISAVLKRYEVNLALNTTMPKKVRPKLYVPSDNDIQQLMELASGTELELPILLAAFGSLRRGEISALDASDLNGNILHVSKTMVNSVDNNWIIKPPKSFAGDRYITLPDFVAKKFPPSGPVTHLRPNLISQRFFRMIRSSSLPEFRFHDLRHYNASIQHALGIPDAYIMQACGWGNDHVLKEVYRHAMPDIQKEMTAIALKHFENMQHEMQHENQKTQ